MGNIADEFESRRERKLKYGDVETPLAQFPHITKYLDGIGAEWVGLSKAAIRVPVGKYYDQTGTIRFNASSQSVDASPKELNPTDAELIYIKDELARVELPHSIPFETSTKMPERFKNFRKQTNSTVYPFKNHKGEVTMYVVRLDKGDGMKTFHPFTYWSDRVVRNQEPDTKLPLFGVENITKNCRVFIHEGMKAASYWQYDKKTYQEKEKLTKHPYFDFLATGIHIGWHGGATNPSQTDWSVLKALGVNELVIVADHDDVGKEAAYKITRESGLKTKLLQFTNDFPKSFDLADELPEKLFGDGENRKFLGRQIDDQLHPATWASYSQPTKDKKVNYQPNPNFVSEWYYISIPQLYVHKDFPNRHLSQQQFSAIVRRFSDDTRVSDILINNRKDEVQNLAYDPSQKTGLVTKSGNTAFNTFVPTKIKPEASDPQPFLDFMKYLMPDDHDRSEAMKWCATLIARPEIRMGYSMLLISEAQGIGKTTLSESILAPLVGEHNVSFPNEQIITGQFNSWAGFKRLAVVSEIYQGEGWKAYHSLKSTITDRYIELNEKHKAAITIENWLHIVASSNSMDALKVASEDRRWLIPKITDVKWSSANFRNFYEWLDSGGLSSIYAWAQNYGVYVQRGQEAPETNTKNEMVRSSRSVFLQEAIALVEGHLEVATPRVVVLGHLIDISKKIETHKCFDRPRAFRRALQEEGWVVCKDRFSVKGRNEYIMLNQQATLGLKGLADDEAKSTIRTWIETASINVQEGNI